MTRTHVMIHHSLTEDGATVSWGAIEDYHRSWRYEGVAIPEARARQLIADGRKGVERPWSDIGYHFGAERVNGRLYALVGRGMHRHASACPQGNMNEVAIHAVLVGNFDLTTPDDALLEFTARRIVQPVLIQFGIPRTNVVGHHDYNPHKSCPGVRFSMEHFRALLE